MSRVDLQYNTDWWIPVDLDREPEQWVPELARQRWAEDGHPDNPLLLEAVIEGLVAVVEAVLVTEPPVFMALLLHPRSDDGAAAVATVRTEDLDEPMDLDEVVAELTLEPQLLEAPAEICRLDTRGGPAVRIVQRYRMPEEPHWESVMESLLYAWVVHDEDGTPLLLTFSTAFEDLVKAEELRPLVEDVARTLAVVD